MRKFIKGLSIVLLLAVIGGCVFAVFNSRQILDYIALYNYDPPAEIVSLADKTSMNKHTRTVFYVNKPDIENKSQFKDSCTSEEQTIVLGCYVESKGIYLLNVDDKRLDGIVEVTAAHEVLHALYDRLSADERNRVDALTNSFFNSLKDERIRQNIENYRSRDPSVVPTELHSILGTEVRDLSPELEEYYSKYFNDRLKIVTLSETYEQTFVELENQVKEYKKQLDGLKTQLDQNDAQITSLGDDIDSRRQEMNRLLKENKVEQYNQNVATFNALVAQYNVLIQSRKSLIAEYNSIVGKYNDVASTEAELVESLTGDEQKTEATIN